MDPFADKLMLMTTLICLCATNRIPLWFPIIIGLKECTMITIGAILYKKDIVLPANIFGKLATILFTLAVLLSFFGEFFAPWHIILLYTATSMALFAMAYYGILVRRGNPQLFKEKLPFK